MHHKSLLHTSQLKGLQNPLLAILILLIVLSFTFPQAGSDIVEKVTNALNKGDVQGLTKHFNNTIDLGLPDSDGTYSDKQAEQLIKFFFKSYPVESFKLDHQGTSNEGSIYMIGTMKSTAGKSFRVYGLINKLAEKEVIQELQFEEE